MKPAIGVFPLWDDDKRSIWMLPAYLDALSRFGALPITLPLEMSIADIDQIVEMCDGFLFTGGHDVNPAIYGVARSEMCGVWSESRDFIEVEILRRALDRDIPIFGICRGIQLFNAAYGGTLYQDLPSEYTSSVSHAMKPPYDTVQHRVTIIDDTPLATLSEGRLDIGVNSYHHQAVRDLAPRFRAMAMSEDGLIEAIYDPTQHFAQALQWHPELNFKVCELSQRIFSKFVEASESYRLRTR